MFAAGRARVCAWGLRPALLLIALAGLVTAAAAQVADSAYVDELIARADALHLADDPAWRALLHYEPRHFGSGAVSAVDSSWFFLAPDGKTDPRAELHATLRQFFVADGWRRDGEPAQCALRGRYLWLDRRLGFEPSRLPPTPCRQYDEFRGGLDAWGVTLIFPEAFMNNPSSMFGHTLLRIDAGPPSGRRNLLSYGVNFSADTGGDGGVAFAWKGITGSYRGRFGIHPYYDIVKEYADWESRDIWEYELTLAPANIDLLLAHVWELRDVDFAYYFFDENCSYQILALLDVARPDLHLRERFPAWVAPADTVRAVVNEPGLLRAASFRASTATQLRHAARELPAAQRQEVRDIARGSEAPDDPRLALLDAREHAAVLGTAYDLFRYEELTQRETTPQERHRARSILLARSDVPFEGPGLPPVPQPAVRPDQGHPIARAGLGAGVRDGRFYLEARLRPGYHDLMDPSGGYTAGAQIDFFALTARWYTRDREVRVHRFTVVDVTSVAPWDTFFQPISWRVATGVFSRLLPENHGSDLKERYVWRSAGGAGIAFEPWAHALAYGFAGATVDVGSALTDDCAVGPGAEVGLFAGPQSDRWKTHLFAEVTRFALGEESTAARAGLNARLSLTAQQALEAAISGNRDFDRNWIEAGITWLYYF